MPVEFQMRFREILTRAAEDREAVLPEQGELGPFLAVSRSAGSGGADMARRVGGRLGWSVMDRELVENLAERLELPPNLLQLMDETRSNWFSDTLLNLMNSRLVLQDSYVAMLGRVMALAAYDGRVVFVGRGASLMLPRSCGLSVRVIASRDFCVRQLAARHGLDERAAARQVDELDSSRNDFIHRHFHRDANDPALYDLVIDTSVFGIEGAAEIVCRALEVRNLV
jgi:cytidylate kinase